MTATDGRGRLLSPMGDMRHRAVLCRACGRRETWAWSAVCDSCHEHEAVPA